VERQIEGTVLHCWQVYTVAVGSMTDGCHDWFYDRATITEEIVRRAETMVASMSAVQSAFEDSASAINPDRALSELSDDLTRALDLALWTFDFRGDLEDALDGALLRSILAGTPTLSGGLLAASSV
jgi:hypothetical protein